MPPAIVCESLTRDFGPVRALDALTLDVPEGSIFAFLGPNGAGKTTAIHLFLGIIEPTSGSSRVLGFDPTVSGPIIRRRSGALLEHAGLYERLSAEENLLYYARIAHLSEDESRERIAEVLTRFGLYERRNDAVVTWSRGMKQKLAIARALLHRPQLVFLDEPTAGLDPEATVALRRDVVSLGTTIFLTTHNLADVEKMATHVAVIRQGQLLDCGTPPELRARALRTRITIRIEDREPIALELADGERIAPIITRLVAEGAQIEEVRRDEPTVEDVFLHLQNVGVRRTVIPSGARDLGERDQPVIPSRSVFRDIATVIRKEWRELSSVAGTGSSKRVNTIIGIALLVVVAGIAALAGARIITSGALLGVTMTIAFIIQLASIGDSFPGERERHTLETLLASALPDEALLLGKIAASTLYGWLSTIVLMVTLLVGANIDRFGAMYDPSTFLALFALTPLMLLFFAAAGVMVCVRAPTVRAAQPRITAFFFALLIPVVAMRPFIPPAWRDQAIALLRTESGRMQTIATQIVLFAILDVVLIAFAVLRFKRSRLI
jgi:ABC-2 type transport system ATP-binding protein